MVDTDSLASGEVEEHSEVSACDSGDSGPRIDRMSTPLLSSLKWKYLKDNPQAEVQAVLVKSLVL